METHSSFCQFSRRDAAAPGGARLWLLFRCLPALLGAGVMLLLLSTASARAGAEGDTAIPEAGQLLLGDAQAGTFAPAVMQSSRVHFAISGMVATVRLEQTFRNTSAGYVEGVYAFPLPETAAVRYLEMNIGERRIVGRVREREQAREIFQAARKAGKKASLVEQQRPNLFTNRVANIGPGESVAVTLEYVQPVTYEAGRFSLRFPATITPRYMPGRPLGVDGTGMAPLVLQPGLGWAVATTEVPDAPAISPLQHPVPGSDRAPLNPVEITAELDMGMPLAEVTSPYHEIALTRRAGVYSLRLASGVSEMDRDFVLQWRPVTGSAPEAALFVEQVEESYYGLLMVVPPQLDAGRAAQPREVIFVVDTSGSMGGVSIEQARASLARGLDLLGAGDRFNIIAFDSNYRALFHAPLPASPHHLERAREFVRHLRASGGTEMLPALRAALSMPQVEEGGPVPLRQLVFVTDGAVGNESALFEEIAASLGDARLFTVGIGSAPNGWFMRKAADFGRGSHSHIGDVGEVEARMSALFEQLSRPAALDVAVDWPVDVEAWPRRVPDLYHGQPLTLAVNFGDQPPSGEVTVRGTVDGRPWRRVLDMAAAGVPAAGVPAAGALEGGGPLAGGDRAGHPGVASLWARRKIAGLLDEIALGRPGDEVRAEVLPLALAHRLLSPYTSFVAVEEVVSRPPDAGSASHAVPNSRPRGQSDQPFAWPRTATTGPAKAWFALLAGFCAILLQLLRSGEADREPPRDR